MRTGREWAGPVAAFLVCGALSGCAAFSNPVGDALPVRRLPPEILGRSKNDTYTIPLTLLHQKPPDVYRLAPGDVLGIYIEGVLGQATQNPPVYFPPQLVGQSALPPATGFPVPVRADGTLALPLVEPITVEGLSLVETEQALIKAYTVTKHILVPGRARVLVSLIQHRQYHVAVVRQEAGGYTSGIGGVVASSTKRGVAFLVDLPAYENDVLTALLRTGGLPGLDAYDEIVVQRNFFKGTEDKTSIQQEIACLPGKCPGVIGAPGEVIKIPLRLHKGEKLPIRPEDIVLRTGDVVFIEARDIELWYSGGLLPPGEHVLPRDYDLDVVEAVAQITGILVRGEIATNSLNGTLVSPGIGPPSPSQLVVLRRLPQGGQIPILVDLNRALQDPRERILVQPQDVLILQETPGEALTRYFISGFTYNIMARFINTSNVQGIATVTPN